MTRYNLLSVPMVHTPGLVRAAIATYGTDKAYWDRVFTEGYSLPLDACEALLSEAVPHTVDADGTVTFEHGEKADA